MHESTTVQADSDPARVVQFPPRPERGVFAVLTPRGDAMVALARFEHMLRDLDASDRAFILDELVEMVRELGHDR